MAHLDELLEEESCRDAPTRRPCLSLYIYISIYLSVYLSIYIYI